MQNFQLYLRWYPSSARLSDGSQIIFGGALAGGFNDYNDNPTVSTTCQIYTQDISPDSVNVAFDQLEFFPPKGNGQPINSQFLLDAMPSNLFPHVREICARVLHVKTDTWRK
jgi:hypothetical protein